MTGDSSWDFETRSPVDLKKAGLDRYAIHVATDIWMLRYQLPGEDGRRVWYPGDPVPAEAADFIRGGGRMFAHNASFERTIWHHILTPRYGWPEPALEQWFCTAAMAAAMSLPRDLAGAANALGLDVEKDMHGRRLMLQMARPRKVTGVGIPDEEADALFEDGGLIFPIQRGREHEVYGVKGRFGVQIKVTWWGAADKIERLDAYCDQDVVVEESLKSKLRPLSEYERRIWLLDQKINDRGVYIDLTSVAHAKAISEETDKRLTAELARLTKRRVTSVNQSEKLTEWLNEQGVDVDSVDKATVKGALALEGLAPEVRRVLEIRQEAGKSSVKKLVAMERLVNPHDSRIRNNLLYHGASTGRWCLAEGTVVACLTADGERVDKPIEKVLPSDLVWDGEAWVEHDGVVFSGIKGVLTWDGVEASPDHVVWLADGTKTTLAEAVSLGAALADGRAP